MTSAQFTNQFAVALGQAMPTLTLKVTGELRLTLEGSGTHSISLDNAYKNYCLAPENRDEIVRKFVASIREISTSESGVEKSRIVPILKDRAWIAEVNQSRKERSVSWLAEMPNTYLSLAI